MRFRLIAFCCITFVLLSKLNGQHWKKDAIKLFNRKNLDGWVTKIHHHEYPLNFGNTFRVNKKKIVVSYDQYGDFDNQFGHLYYHQPFSFFHLRLEYRFVGSLQPGAPDFTLLNSGVMFHSQDPATMPKEQDWPISVEMQFLAGLGDGKPRPTGNMCSPGTDIVFQGKTYPGHCLNSSSPTLDKNVWVKAELVVLGDSLVQHFINGQLVLEYSKPTMGGGVANRYDNSLWEPGKALKSGFIALQSEGQPIEFRNIELINLKGCLDPGAKNYKPYYIASDPSTCVWK